MNKQNLQNNILKIIFSAVAALLLFLCIHFYTQKDASTFKKFTGQLFISELSNDTLSMHYSVMHPENYGINSYQVALPDYNDKAYGTGCLSIENKLSFLQSIDRKRLNKNDALTFDILYQYLKDSLKTTAYPYYEEPLSPGSGIQSQLPILLAEYSFTCKKDIEDYLGLLNSCKSYFSSIGEFEADKSERGLFMPDYSADKVIQQCNVIMDPALLKNKTHFLITTFEERAEAAAAKGFITEQEKKAFSAENERLLTSVVQPAYASLGDTILLLKGTSQNDRGLCYRKDGQKYYELSLRHNTGSGKSIQELKEVLYRRLKEDVSCIQALADSINTLKKEDVNYAFPMEVPEDMLIDLQEQIKEDYPSFPTPEDIDYTVKKVNENLQDFVSPAFYLTPQIDNIKDNVIYINQQSIPDNLEMYTTLAHEGYPGHMYQSVYHQLYQNTIDGNPARNLLYFGGYTEGWALYVENISYDYAKEVISRSDEDAGKKEFLKLYADLYKTDRDMRLCLYSILDIAIHYDGITPDDTHRILSQFGIKNMDTALSIYQYIVEERTNSYLQTLRRR